MASGAYCFTLACALLHITYFMLASMFFKIVTSVAVVAMSYYCIQVIAQGHSGKLWELTSLHWSNCSRLV